MYAITGITGKVGGELVRNLLAAGQRVRAIVRNESKGEEWAALGCEVALANTEDGLALADAFAGATATFILPPSEFDPEPGFPEARHVIAADDEDRAAIAALPRDQRYVTPPFAPDWNALTL
jgi:NAD(P)H dehydrogenase (quinone)